MLELFNLMADGQVIMQSIQGPDACLAYAKQITELLGITAQCVSGIDADIVLSTRSI